MLVRWVGSVGCRVGSCAGFGGWGGLWCWSSGAGVLAQCGRTWVVEFVRGSSAGVGGSGSRVVAVVVPRG